MSKQRAFTLAEILIVLTIVGVMAVMTIPSLLQNANSQQKIAMFKKGFNAVSNAYATEFATKTPPKDNNDGEKLWEALNNQLNVKYYVNTNTGDKKYTIEDAKEIDWEKRVIMTEDGIGYRVTRGNAEDNFQCQSKLTVNKVKSGSDLVSSSCLNIGVLLDNAYKIANKVECQYNYSESSSGDTQDLNNLKCNAIWLPVAKEGITAGNPDCTITGRIISGVNPRPASCSEE